MSAIVKPEQHQSKKPFSDIFKISNGNSPFSLSSAWPKARSLWTNFNENFFSDGFSDTTFGDWKSKIEERSNKVLKGYNDNPRNEIELIKGMSKRQKLDLSCNEMFCNSRYLIVYKFSGKSFSNSIYIVLDQPTIEVSKPRGRSLPHSVDSFHSIKHPNTLYRENIVDEFVEKIIEPQLKDEQNQVINHGKVYIKSLDSVYTFWVLNMII